GTFNEVDEPPIWSDDLEIFDSGKVYDFVLSNAGARPADRSPIDQRIINNIRNRNGNIIDSQEEVGGYPDPEPVHRELDIPPDNVQEWLNEMAREVER
ncbi:MAG: hypothetical protein KGY69_18125, partial [Bacteroidales bacterium]|nr:hypothetical protein [Bacteroidales bacterium]